MSHHNNHHPPAIAQQNHQHQHNQQQQQQQQQQHQQSHHKQQAAAADSWVCVLCRKICHYRGLGDLYGPYNIDFSETSNKCKSITPKKSRFSLLNHNYAVREIWVHEDCLVWSEGVHLVGKKILKMDDVIKSSFNHNCSLCKTKGATIGCVGKRCRKKFHYICARDANCLLDEANFTLKCDKCLADTSCTPQVST